VLSDQILWYATRSAGIVSWFAASASVVAGLLMSSRLLGRKPTIPWLLDLHRYLGAFSILFLVVHLVTLWLDPFVELGPAELLVPGKAQIPGLSSRSLTLGVAAGWILVLVEATSLVKKRLPKGAWHTVHLCSFGTVVMGTIHGIETGSDIDNRVLVAAATSVLMTMVLIGMARIVRLIGDHRYRREAGPPAGLTDRIPAEAASDRIPAGLRQRAAGAARSGGEGGGDGRAAWPPEERPAPEEPVTGPAEPVVATRAGQMADSVDGVPPWATGPHQVVTQTEASWNNGETTWDWNKTLAAEGSWSLEEQHLTASPVTPAGHDRPAAAPTGAGPPHRPAAPRRQPPPAPRPDRPRPQPAGTSPLPDRSGAVAPGTASHRSRRSAPAGPSPQRPASRADGVTPRWGLYRTAEHRIDCPDEAEILPFPGNRSRMSYREGEEALRRGEGDTSGGAGRPHR
jgi:DMSO/TMAO reductase YedYZ heme-binding membrane subunit